MSDSWLGSHTLPTVWIYICLLFNWVGILTLAMLIIAEFIIIVQNFTAHVVQVGYTYPSVGYPGTASCGFVDYTNAPKQLGGALWMLGYQVSIIIIASLTIASDLAWRTASYNKWGGQYVTAFFAVGILAGDHNKELFYYVVANAFLKFYLVCLYLSQTFLGLNIPWTQIQSRKGGQRSSSWTTPHGPGGAGGGYASASISATAEVGVWKRDLVGVATGTQSWAIWTGWLLFGSILPSVIAFVYLVPWAAKVKGAASDAEKATAAPPPAPAAPKAEKKDKAPKKEGKEKSERPERPKRPEKPKD